MKARGWLMPGNGGKGYNGMPFLFAGRLAFNEQFWLGGVGVGGGVGGGGGFAGGWVAGRLQAEVYGIYRRAHAVNSVDL